MARSALLVALCALIAACPVVISPTLILEQPPFATEQLSGTVSDAVRCIADFWQAEATRLFGGVYTWEVESEPAAVKVRGPGGGTPPVSLIIKVSDQTGETIANAYTHPVFGATNPRQTVTVRALQACKGRPKS